MAPEHFQVASTNNTTNGPIAHTVNQKSKNTVSCGRSVDRQADTKKVASHFFQVHDNEATDLLKRIYNYDFTEFQHVVNKEMGGVSQEIKKFLKILEKCAKLDGGHYEIPFPFRRENL